jgi:hypothetical protein
VVGGKAGRCSHQLLRSWAYIGYTCSNSMKHLTSPLSPFCCMSFASILAAVNWAAQVPRPSLFEDGRQKQGYIIHNRDGPKICLNMFEHRFLVIKPIKNQCLNIILPIPNIQDEKLRSQTYVQNSHRTCVGILPTSKSCVANVLTLKNHVSHMCGAVQHAMLFTYVRFVVSKFQRAHTCAPSQKLFLTYV